VTSTLIPWILTAISLIGVVLNVKRKRSGFGFWIIANIGWVVVDYQAGLTSQAVLFIVYTALAGWGLLEWREKA